MNPWHQERDAMEHNPCLDAATSAHTSGPPRRDLTVAIRARWLTASEAFLLAASETSSVEEAIREIRAAFKLLRWKQARVADRLGATVKRVGRPNGPGRYDALE